MIRWDVSNFLNKQISLFHIQIYREKIIQRKLRKDDVFSMSASLIYQSIYHICYHIFEAMKVFCWCTCSKVLIQCTTFFIKQKLCEATVKYSRYSTLLQYESSLISSQEAAVYACVYACDVFSMSASSTIN